MPIHLSSSAYRDSSATSVAQATQGVHQGAVHLWNVCLAAVITMATRACHVILKLGSATASMTPLATTVSSVKTASMVTLPLGCQVCTAGRHCIMILFEFFQTDNKHNISFKLQMTVSIACVLVTWLLEMPMCLLRLAKGWQMASRTVSTVQRATVGRSATTVWTLTLALLQIPPL